MAQPGADGFGRVVHRLLDALSGFGSGWCVIHPQPMNRRQRPAADEGAAIAGPWDEDVECVVDEVSGAGDASEQLANVETGRPILQAEGRSQCSPKGLFRRSVVHG